MVNVLDLNFILYLIIEFSAEHVIEIGLGHTVASVHKSLNRYTRSPWQGYESPDK